MHRLFALILFATANISWAAPGKVSVSTISGQQILIDSLSSNSTSQSLQLTSPTLNRGLVHGVTFGAGLEMDQVDLANRRIVQKNGVTVPLSDIDSGHRRIINFQTEWQNSDWLVSTRHSQDLDPSAYSAKSYGAQIQHGFYNRASVLTLDLSRSALSQPDSVFVQPETLKTESLATQFNKDQVKVQWEQIWADNFKNMFELADIQSPLIRPQSYFFGLKNVLALTSRQTFRVDLGLVRENENENLKTDRGYFRSEWVELQWTYEYSLDSFAGFSASTLHESEQDSRRNFSRALGTDAVGIFVQHQIKNLNLSGRILNAINSDQQRRNYFEGGLTWNI